MEDKAFFGLLKSFLRRSAFTALRTNLQLGYVVSAGMLNKGNILGAYVLVQGNKETPDKVDKLIEKFLKEAAKGLKEMDFEQYRSSYVTKLENKIQKLKDQSDEESKQVLKGIEEFDERKKMIKIVKAATKEDMIKFYEDIFKNNVKKLSIQMYNSQVEIPTSLPSKEDKNNS